MHDDCVIIRESIALRQNLKHNEKGVVKLSSKQKSNNTQFTHPFMFNFFKLCLPYKKWKTKNDGPEVQYSFTCAKHFCTYFKSFFTACKKQKKR